MGDLNVEITLFNIIGGCLLLGTALTFLVPLLVWIGNGLCSALWAFIDEGETKWKDRFTSTYLFEKTRGKADVVYVDDFWRVRVQGAGAASQKPRYIYSDGGIYGSAEAQRYNRFESKEAAETFLLVYSEGIDKYMCLVFPSQCTFSTHFLLNAVSVPLGIGFLFFPTITLFSGAALLSLYSLRWARRGVKLAKKVKSSLDSHISDKDAHKG